MSQTKTRPAGKRTAAERRPKNVFVPAAPQDPRSQDDGLNGSLFDVLNLLSAPGAFDLRQVSQVAARALAQDAQFDTKLVRLVRTDGAVSADTAIRILRVLECICSKPRLLEHLLSLKNLDGRVRSKVALTVGRLLQNPVWLGEQLRDGNPRVRANAVEALWGVQVLGVEHLLYQAAEDRHNRVIANAALGLHKMGNMKCVPIIDGLIQHKIDLWRRSGLWVAGQTGDPRYLPKVAEHLKAGTEEERTLAELAVKTLTDAQSRSRFLPELTLEMSELKSVNGGLRVATVNCIAQSLNRWLDPFELNALDFVICEGNRQIDEHAFRPASRRGDLSVAILIPEAWAASAPLFRELWPAAREEERVGLVPFHSGDATARHHGMPEESAVVFGNRIESAVERLERGDIAVAGNLEEAILGSLKALDQVSGWRHLIVLIDPCTRVALSPTLSSAVHHHGIQIHAVVSKEADGSSVEAVRRLCERSCGKFTKATAAGALQTSILSIRGAHSGSMELSWMGSGPILEEVTLTCRAKLGFGITTSAKDPAA